MCSKKQRFYQPTIDELDDNNPPVYVTEYKVYDNVYVLEDSRIRKKIIYAIVERMNFFKTGTDTYYLLVDSQLGACEEKSLRRTAEEMFATKEDVANYLLEKA